MTIIGEAMKRQGLSTAIVAERSGYSWWLIDRLAHDEALLARANLVQVGSAHEGVTSTASTSKAAAERIIAPTLV